MTNIKNVVVLGATIAAVVFSNSALAQDDLDKLLQELDGGDKKAEVKETAAAAEPVAETPAPAAPVEVKDSEEVPQAESVAAVEEAPLAVAEEKPAAVEPVVAEAAAPAVPEAAAPAAPETAKAETAGPDAEILSNVVATEQLRRKALDSQARREILEARRCMENSEYSEAVRHYGLAQKLLNDRASSKNLRKECEQGIAEGLYRAAMQEDDLGRREKALELMEKALDMRHPKARRVLARWVNEGEKIIEVSSTDDLRHRKSEDDYKKKHEFARRHLRRSRQLMSQNEFEKALEECEIVLLKDAYNQDALRLRLMIQEKRDIVLKQEREATREGMIADVDEAWRPVYAPNVAKLDDAESETVKKQTGENTELTEEQIIENRMKAMRLPTISFKPPATIIDAVDFFRGASKDYDRPDIPIEKRGFNFVLKTPQGALKQQSAAEDSGDDFAAAADDSGSEMPNNGLPPIPTITASDITFYEALKLVCDSVDYKFIVRGPVVMVMHKDMSTAELLSRKYDVLDAFLDRMTSASSDMKEMRSAGFGGGTQRASSNDDDEENQEKDWKAFFEQMGVKWPEGSSIMYIKTLGKLYVRNTRENLAEFEKVLEEMGSQPKLIEIETRFVEVSQEDLNSLGFEWILNSDYSLDINNKLGKALGIKEGVFPGGAGETLTQVVDEHGRVRMVNVGNNTFDANGPTPGIGQKWDSANNYNVSDPNGPYPGATRPFGSGNRNVGINAFGGTSGYSNGNRYLSTMDNHIAGQGSSINDQFMRVNAFLGSADLSMILHMLAQRSDTDLLSAPKVVTKSGENAVIKVVTEYIYPQDYDVQLQSSSSSSSSYGSSSQSSVLAIVEPQNFTMREVGVILNVTPTYSEANGGTIDLELKPQVVDEPTWKNYGMQIPFTGNAQNNNFEGIGDILNSAVNAIDKVGGEMSSEIKNLFAQKVVDSATQSLENFSNSGKDNMTWYDVPMEQPFFHCRSIDSKVSITPGSTVVMGGLITEARKAMDDKVPFLGDLPFIGRLFRSHSEWTSKRNLLIFVTGRLITPSGRELRTDNPEVNPADVAPAPKAG